MQEALTEISAAGEYFPYDYRFRQMQAHALYRLAANNPDMAPYAIISLKAALRSDPLAADLTLALFDLETRTGGKDAAMVAERLRWLAPNSDLAKAALKERGF